MAWNSLKIIRPLQNAPSKGSILMYMYSSWNQSNSKIIGELSHCNHSLVRNWQMILKPTHVDFFYWCFKQHQKFLHLKTRPAGGRNPRALNKRRPLAQAEKIPEPLPHGRRYPCECGLGPSFRVLA